MAPISAFGRVVRQDHTGLSDDPGRPCRGRCRRCPAWATSSSANASASGSAPVTAPRFVIPRSLCRDAVRPGLRPAAGSGGERSGNAGAARPITPNHRDAGRAGDPVRPARRRCAGASHEPRPFRAADAGDDPLAADAAVPARRAGRRPDRAADHPARGGAADQRADGRHHGARQRPQGARRGRSWSPSRWRPSSRRSTASSTSTARRRTTV